MYTPKHLQWLDDAPKDSYGWPFFVTAEAREWCVTAVRRGMTKYGRMDLEMSRLCVFGDYVREPGEKKHECLKLFSWDAMYGITYRALLAANATDYWELKP